MATTTGRALSYPVGTSPADVPADIKKLAEDVRDELMTMPRLIGISSGSLLGGTKAAGAQLLFQTGKTTVTTNSSSIGVLDLTANFPNGVLSAILMPHNNSLPNISVNDAPTLGAVTFTVRNNVGEAAGAVAVTFSFLVFGW